MFFLVSISLARRCNGLHLVHGGEIQMNLGSMRSCSSSKEIEQSFETNFKGKLSTLGSSHYMASMGNEQRNTSSTIKA